jgi:zinc transport system substrate-binding protein
MTEARQLRRRGFKPPGALGLATTLWAAALILGGALIAEARRPLSVFVSIPPQAYFVRRIAGPLADVHVLIGPGQSPHTFEPTPRQLTAMSKCDVYFAIGLPFEGRIIEKLSETDACPPVVDTSRGVKRLSMHGEAYDHEPPVASEHPRTHRADHHRGLPDPHTWLDPERAAVQAGNACDKLCELAPEHATALRDSLTALVNDLRALDKEIEATLLPLTGKRVYVVHPAFGYFASAYGLTQVSLESNGTGPGPRELAALIDRAMEENVRAVFVQPQHSSRAAEALAAEIGARVVPLDPLAEDYIANLRSMANAVAASVAEQRKEPRG